MTAVATLAQVRQTHPPAAQAVARLDPRFSLLERHAPVPTPSSLVKSCADWPWPLLWRCGVQVVGEGFAPYYPSFIPLAKAALAESAAAQERKRQQPPALVGQEEGEDTSLLGMKVGMGRGCMGVEAVH